MVDEGRKEDRVMGEREEGKAIMPGQAVFSPGRFLSTELRLLFVPFVSFIVVT